MSKFYESAAFKKLNSEWQKKLEKKGFDEQETAEGYLKRYDTLFFKTHYDAITSVAKQTYYRLACQFLHEHKFETPLQYKIWAYHCEGKAHREIDKLTRNFSKSYKGHATKCIHKLRAIMRANLKKAESYDE